MMKSISIIAACIAVALAAPALAQTGLIPSPNLTAPPPDRAIPEAPIGHRQPRATELPPPQGQPGNPQTTEDDNARQDAALDRKIKGICKGC